MFRFFRRSLTIGKPSTGEPCHRHCGASFRALDALASLFKGAQIPLTPQNIQSQSELEKIIGEGAKLIQAQKQHLDDTMRSLKLTEARYNAKMLDFDKQTIEHKQSQLELAKAKLAYDTAINTVATVQAQHDTKTAELEIKTAQLETRTAELETAQTQIKSKVDTIQDLTSLLKATLPKLIYLTHRDLNVIFGILWCIDYYFENKIDCKKKLVWTETPDEAKWKSFTETSLEEMKSLYSMANNKAHATMRFDLYDYYESLLDYVLYLETKYNEYCKDSSHPIPQRVFELNRIYAALDGYLLSKYNLNSIGPEFASLHIRPTFKKILNSLEVEDFVDDPTEFGKILISRMPTK